MPATRLRSTPATTPYLRLVDAHDLVHAAKPYRAEALRVRQLAVRYARRPLRELLDVACGSGRHLAEFVRWFRCTGLDASPAMLSAARRRVPRAAFHRGRMERFDLRRRFDVVTCLFGAIGYVETREGLRRALRAFAEHTQPGGVLVLEPWLTPERYQEGSVHSVKVTDGTTTVLRLTSSLRQGNRSVMEFHYLVGTSAGVVHDTELHVLGLFGTATMLRELRSAGFVPHHLARGLATGRGLYVATRRADRGRGPLRGSRRRPRAVP